MTLLIACLLIYHIGLPGWWYAFAILYLVAALGTKSDVGKSLT